MPAPFPILHLAPGFLVIDKPAGLAVHPGPRTPHSLEALLPALAHHLGDRTLPRLMHRLDRDTSGCLLLARTPAATRHFARAFETRQIRKTYLALLACAPNAASGIIEAPLAKVSTAATGWRMVIDPAGRPAITHWRLLDSAMALVELTPRTGRTHQLRAHAAHALSPILGDPVYGDGHPAGPMRLHARGLILPLPGQAPDAEHLAISAPWPQHWPEPSPAIYKDLQTRTD